MYGESTSPRGQVRGRKIRTIKKTTQGGQHSRNWSKDQEATYSFVSSSIKVALCCVLDLGVCSRGKLFSFRARFVPYLYSPPPPPNPHTHTKVTWSPILLEFCNVGVKGLYIVIQLVVDAKLVYQLSHCTKKYTWKFSGVIVGLTIHLRFSPRVFSPFWNVVDEQRLDV